MPTSTAARAASYTELAIGIFGLFGNVNILVAVARKKNLRSKCYLLIALIALYDTIAIVFEYFQALVFIFEVVITTKQCFQTIWLFFFTLNMQIVTVLSVAVDRLLAVAIPTRYRLISAKKWILLTLLPGVAVNAIFVPWAYFTTNDLPVNGCNPPSSIPDDVAFWWSKLTVAINVVVVVTYIAVIITIRFRARSFSTSSHDQQAKNFFLLQQKAMRTVSVIIVVICCTWFLTQAIAFLYYAFPELLDHPWFVASSELVVIPVISGYSANYYVYFWRNSEYRQVFKEQLAAICPCLKQALQSNKVLFSKTSSTNNNGGSAL
ncbi:hypothetical protein QR680_014913 [Steinernema hermaphroditum]|uniref:G-protein coupled receptors family 1 profile domain-containing protein n=1 Tax=Steinernema hermaphroditum TaxID=289476 RepID=A0AA39M525_9BILA|nr:hypothetical protein QR680_014913 [Steinernema hermaphroditum]